MPRGFFVYPDSNALKESSKILLPLYGRYKLLLMYPRDVSPGLWCVGLTGLGLYNLYSQRVCVGTEESISSNGKYLIFAAFQAAEQSSFPSDCV